MNKTVFDIANYFLSRESMTHKKLQKLCYYYVAWGYALYDEAMIINPTFQAWVHGPVSPELYSKYYSFGWNPIPKTDKLELKKFEEKEDKLLSSVWDTYSDKCGDELEALTHSELPWIEARKGLDEYEPSKNVISPEIMKIYYSSIYIGGQGE